MVNSGACNLGIKAVEVSEVIKEADIEVAPRRNEAGSMKQ
jgi:hypothetical protein